jgi:hypothetical protein
MNEVKGTATVSLANTFSITLPSDGLLYDGKVPEGKLSLRPLTAKELSVLYSPGGDPMIKLNMIINSCVVDCKIDPLDFLLTDRMYILMILRTRSMGAMYQFPLKCDACSAQYKEEIDISKELKTKKLAPDTKEPVSLKLPNSGDDITYKFLRGRDENAIAKSAKRILMQSSDPSDPSFIMRIATMIQSVNDKADLDYYAKEQYVSGLDAGDINEISNDVEERESGISLIVNTECKKCGYLDEVLMPFTAEFFRPKRGKAI